MKGEQHYRFTAWHRTENIAVPRRSVLARVLWRDQAGKEVKRRDGVVTNFSLGVVASAEPEYPRDAVEKGTVNNGWVEMSGIYEAPPGATQARVELHLLWAPNGKVEWSDVAFLRAEAPAPRKVRLSSVHLHCACMRLVARGPDFMLEAHMPEATFGQDELADIEPPLQADP